ncbi:MAG: hypothetical protein ACYCZR_06120 [Burkholderiales bacterium]
MSAELQERIEAVQDIRAELQSLEAKLDITEQKRRAMALQDDYEAVDAMDHLEPGGSK